MDPIVYLLGPEQLHGGSPEDYLRSLPTPPGLYRALVPLTNQGFYQRIYARCAANASAATDYTSFEVLDPHKGLVRVSHSVLHRTLYAERHLRAVHLVRATAS